MSTLICLYRHNHCVKLTDNPGQSQVKWIMEKQSSLAVHIFILHYWIFFERLGKIARSQTTSENDRHPTYLPDTSEFHPLFQLYCSHSHLLDMNFPLQLSSLLFVFYMVSGSSLRLWFLDIYIMCSIGIFITFPKTRMVSWSAVLERESSRPFLGPLRKEKYNEEYWANVLMNHSSLPKR